MENQTTLPAANFSAETRNLNLIRLAQETFDLLVIGGGITGAAIANEAARRGYKVALVEQGDFASGTSSRSSKLIHGGLRYLATLKFGLVLEACHQRDRLLELAPHLVWPLPFVLPVYRNGFRSLGQIRTAMWLYDALATFHHIPGHSLWSGQRLWPGHRMYSANRILAEEPLLKSHDLLGAARYYDCGTDDARLTLVTLLDAHRAGAVLANYTKVIGLLQTRSRVVGAQVCDRRSGVEVEVRARIVMSAVGPWTDKLLSLAGRSVQSWLHPTKGAHIVVSRERLSSQAALTFNAPGDGRFMFLVPWGSRAIIGTTDTDYSGDPDELFATSEDVTYILEAAQNAFPSARLSEDDVISTYAGVRPLIRERRDCWPHIWSRSNDTRSRQHRISEVRPGLIAIAGGKFTTHRPMARAAVNEVAHILAYEYHTFPAEVKNDPSPPLPGGEVDDWHTYQAQQQAAIAAGSGLPDEVTGYLVTTYGSEVSQVLMLLAEQPTLAECITPDLPVIKAQVVHAIRQEMALTLTDILDRRTHVMTRAADQGLGAVQAMADLMVAELGWTPAERAAQVAAYRQAVATSRRWRDGRHKFSYDGDDNDDNAAHQSCQLGQTTSNQKLPKTKDCLSPVGRQ